MRNKLRLKSKLTRKKKKKKPLLLTKYNKGKDLKNCLSIHLITLINKLIPYLWMKSGIMLQQTNINLIDFNFLRFFKKLGYQF